MEIPVKPGGKVLTTETVVKPLAGTLLALTAVRSNPPPGNDDAAGVGDTFTVMPFDSS